MRILLVMVMAFLFVSCSSDKVSLSGTGSEGQALCKVAMQNTGNVGHAELKVHGEGMATISRIMQIIQGQGLEGRIDCIPIGKSRKFKILVYDTIGTVQYEGETEADVYSDVPVQITIILKRVVGDAVIIGQVDTVEGYRYYRMVVEAKDLGGPNEVIMTELSFMDSVPVLSGYKVLLNNGLVIGRVDALFDGDITAGVDSYIKFNGVPWEIVLDMGYVRRFSRVHVATWEDFFYHIPSRVRIYGGDDTETWYEIGLGEYVEVYSDKFISLTY